MRGEESRCASRAPRVAFFKAGVCLISGLVRQERHQRPDRVNPDWPRWPSSIAGVEPAIVWMKPQELCTLAELQW